ncbi:hypothetical protein [Elizabethkingia anophelis]|uniref:hypothetical protein n=1 Tax=Elizabethkingia anophelis TaxID=1117645 RepID=UPI00136C1AD7|nr:hypothetical protein [Elizabethkingia anophelis]MYY27398.1 hypothetical protein [Elizabethkingia anophelis]
MQKALRLMTVRIDIAIRDIVGKSGITIFEAILKGSRDLLYLASLVDIRVKRSKEEIAKSLQGIWRNELLFELEASLKLYNFYNHALMECDGIIEKLVINRTHTVNITNEQEKNFKKYNRQKTKNAPLFNISKIAFHSFGTDLFAIRGKSHNTVLCLLTNIGSDKYKFPTAKSFAS